MVAVEDLEDLARVAALGERGEPADVAEQDGHVHLPAGEPQVLVGLGQDLPDHLLGDEAGEGVSARAGG